MNNKKLFVGSLPWGVDDAKLGELFAQAGNVVSAQVVKDRETGRSRGFGFVEMPNDEEAQRAISELNGANVQGRTIVVNKSEPKPEGERRSFNNNRGGGDRGGYRGGNSGGGYNRGGGGDYNRGGSY